MPHESTLGERDDGSVSQIGAASMEIRGLLIRLWTSFDLRPDSAMIRARRYPQKRSVVGYGPGKIAPATVSLRATQRSSSSHCSILHDEQVARCGPRGTQIILSVSGRCD
jgi:hypothetical protein